MEENNILKIKLVEIITAKQVETVDDIQKEIPEESSVVVENGFRYEEDLTLDSIEKEKNEKIIRKKKGEKVPTRWEKMNKSEKENMYFGLRINAYKTECDRLSIKYPGRTFDVRVE